MDTNCLHPRVLVGYISTKFRYHLVTPDTILLLYLVLLNQAVDVCNANMYVLSSSPFPPHSFLQRRRDPVEVFDPHDLAAVGVGNMRTKSVNFLIQPADRARRDDIFVRHIG